jgi:hypothetical protein
MTRIIKNTVVAGMVAGLMVGSLGSVQAETIGGGGNGSSFEWTVPTVGAPKLSFELNGEKHEIGGEDAIGGLLRVAFRGSDWAISYTVPDCAANQIGKGYTFVGKTPSASLDVSYTPLDGETRGYTGAPVDGRTPTSSFSLCV